MLAALGGVAVGLGVSAGGLAIGTVAVGGVAVGFQYAIGGVATGPAIVDAKRCDQAALEFLRRWLPALGIPRSCR
jgi:hypothetical protein